MVLLGKDFTTLVKLATRNTYILVFCGFCSENHLHRFQMNTVNFAQCRQKADNNRCRRGKTTNRQTSFDDAGQTNFQPVLLAQHLCCATQMVSPISFFFLWHCIHEELRTFREIQRLQFHNTIVFRMVCHVDALINCQPIDLAILVINVSSKRADAVRTESYTIRFLMV